MGCTFNVKDSNIGIMLKHIVTLPIISCRKCFKLYGSICTVNCENNFYLCSLVCLSTQGGS